MSRTDWEVVIGLEIHAQLNTASKIFSGASTAFGAEPNRQASAVDIALPGTLPVLNRGAVERAMRFGLAIGAHVAEKSVFARKNYFYPDLPKGYQISQMDLPVVQGGEITIRVGDAAGGENQAYDKTVRLTRAHLEEDAGKSLHEDFHGMTGIDLNRAGTPLLEIVSEPDMRSSAEAVAYARAVHALVRWIDICDGNMQEGSFRCDANVSVRRKGAAEFGTRREIKNLNSFRFLQQAIDYEVRWQIETLEEGGAVQQATVLFDPERGETRVMRTKEDAHDYRYFPDPDLLPLVIDRAWIEEVRASLPELPQALRRRLVEEHGLTPYDANLLTASKELADYYLTAVAAVDPVLAKPCANWILGELAARLNRSGIEIGESPVRPAHIAALARRVQDGTISHAGAKKVFEALWAGAGEDVDAIIQAQGLKQVSDESALEALVEAAIAANPKSVEEFRAGKEKALNALVGQVMKASRGAANPQRVTELLRRKLTA